MEYLDKAKFTTLESNSGELISLGPENEGSVRTRFLTPRRVCLSFERFGQTLE